MSHPDIIMNPAAIIEQKIHVDITGYVVDHMRRIVRPHLGHQIYSTLSTNDNNNVFQAKWALCVGVVTAIDARPYILWWLSWSCFQMRQMTHENVNTFVGACIDQPKAAFLMGTCSRGSLQVSFYGINIIGLFEVWLPTYIVGLFLLTNIR